MMELKNLISTSKTVDIYQNGSIAVKVFKEGSEKMWPLYEALTHARVEATGLNVPKIHEVSVSDNRWAIHMDLIEGKTLASIIKENPDNTDKYISMMLDIQLEIHSKVIPELSKYKDVLKKQINSLEEIDDIVKYELLTRLSSMPKHNKLCHGNFTPENIIINDKGTYIIDWIAAGRGNASADIGKTFLMLSLQMPEAAEKYLDLFCERTNTSKKYVQEWLPIVAAARLIEGKDEERELLLKWVNVTSYE